MNKCKEHTFAICAYKESIYLEECIKSLKEQTLSSNIIICTSTPNEYIFSLASKYDIKVYINDGEKGIGQDWNFAVKSANTKYVTVAHQDDIYKPMYLEKVLNKMQTGQNIIGFCNYKEIKNGEEIPKTINLKIKNILQKPLEKKRNKKFWKKVSLCFGCSICCPSVTLNCDLATTKPYKTELKCDLDWDTWDSFARGNYGFAYVPEELMCHRIHELSETSNLIENNVRLEEDYLMFKRYWPDFIAKILMSQYKKAIKTNKV